MKNVRWEIKKLIREPSHSQTVLILSSFVMGLRRWDAKVRSNSIRHHARRVSRVLGRRCCWAISSPLLPFLPLSLLYPFLTPSPILFSLISWAFPFLSREEMHTDGQAESEWCFCELFGCLEEWGWTTQTLRKHLSDSYVCCAVLNCSVVSDSLQPHGL